MIEISLIGDNKKIINAELIKWMESLPKTTIITLTTGDKLISENSIDEIIERVIKYKRSIYCQKLEEKL